MIGPASSAEARAVFERHLDLAPLRGRSRGKVRCIFHTPDRHPSLDVDLERGLFICRSCGTSGGLKRFRELVGEPFPALPIMSARRWQLWRSSLDEARLVVLREVPEQPWARPFVLALYAGADWVRIHRQWVERARHAATIVGATRRAWKVLAAAAVIESSAYALETLLDELTDLLSELRSQ